MRILARVRPRGVHRAPLDRGLPSAHLPPSRGADRTHHRTSALGIVGLTILTLASGGPSAQAAWAPFAVSQTTGAQQVPVATTDGAGGSIVAFMGDQSGSQAVYAHHILASGGVDPAWPANGRLLGVGANDYAIVSDGSGGAIVVRQANATDMIANRVLASGALDPAWPSGGVVVRTGTSNAFWIRAVSDGAGGVVCTWSDERNSATAGLDIYAQRVRSTGVTDPAWPVNGAAVYAGAGDQVLDAAVSDGSGGIIAVYEDNRNGSYDVYAQRVVSTGAIASGWPAGGRQLCGEAGDQQSIVACSDGSGGAIAAWTDRRNNSYDIYAMRVQSNGHTAGGWANDGELVVPGSGNDGRYVDDIVADGSGGAVIAWGSGSSSNVYVQKVTSSGALSWTPDGVEVSVAEVDQDRPVLAVDGSGGVYVAWEDGRFWTDQTPYHYLFMHHVLSSGTPDPSWPVDGGRIGYAPGSYFTKTLVANASGGAIVLWDDGPNDVYGMTFNSTWTPPHGLQVSIALPGAGSVTRNPDLPSYGAGASVSLTAVPNTGHAFIAWSGDASGSTNPLTVTMNATKSITANFDGYAVNVAVSPAGGGSVAKNPDQPTYTPNSSVTLTASPSTGYGFSGWSGDAAGATNPLTITVDGPKNITASFAGYPVDVTVVPSGSGTVSKNPNQATYAPGSSVTLTASAAQGYTFNGWSGDASGMPNPLTITVNGPKAITANFLLPPPACGNWSPLTSATRPSPREAAAMAWDPVRHRALMFGGYNSLIGYWSDLWQFTVAQGWTQLTPAGTPPPGRDAAGLIYDPVRDRVLVVGGYLNGSPLNDVWQLTLTATPTWTQITPSGTPPPGRHYFSTIYDPIRDRIILFGGYPNTNDVWSLSLAGTPTWTQLAPTGTAPAARYGHVAIYDPVRDRMLVHGGSNLSLAFQDTWALSLAGTPAWSAVSTIGPAPRVYLAAGVYDPIRDRLLVVSGVGSTGSGTKSLSLEIQPTWSEIPAGGVDFGSRFLPSAVYEPQLDLLLVFLGFGSQGYMIDADRRLDCAGGWWLQTGATNTNGTVAATPVKACYGNGDVVNLQAVGQGGYVLYQWLGDASGAQPSINVTMNDNKTIVAQFATGAVAVDDAPLTFALDPILPNPNRGPVRVSYALPQDTRVRLGVYDLAGRQVALLADGEVPAGRHVADWDGRLGGARATSGVYFVRFEASSQVWTQRFVLVR